MKDKHLVIVGQDKLFEFPYVLGGHHLDDYKQFKEKCNIDIDLSNDFSAACSVATMGGYLSIINAKVAITLVLPPNLCDFHIKYLKSIKQELYALERNGVIIEIAIVSMNPVKYNRNQYYRDLGVEQKIAQYEGYKIASQLDILFNEIDKQQVPNRKRL